MMEKVTSKILYVIVAVIVVGLLALVFNVFLITNKQHENEQNNVMPSVAELKEDSELAPDESEIVSENVDIINNEIVEETETQPMRSVEESVRNDPEISHLPQEMIEMLVASREKLTEDEYETFKHSKIREYNLKKAIQEDQVSEAKEYPANVQSKINKVESIDKEKYSQITRDFINALFTYDDEIINSQEHFNNVSQYVEIGSQTGLLLTELFNNDWRYAMSTYEEFYGVVNYIDEPTFFVSQVLHEGLVTATVKVVLCYNQGSPGELDWQVVNQYEDVYQVYFTDSGKIIDIQRVKTKIIEGDIFDTQHINSV